MRLLRWLALGIVVSMTVGCAGIVAPPYSADYAALDRLKGQALDKAAVAPVQPTDPGAAVNKISLRAASLLSPRETFSRYLEDALTQDLREVGLYDPNARTRIDATILKNEMDISGFSKGQGRMEVALTVTRAGTQRLKKTYRVDTEFESSFAGAVAIPKGQLEYGNLVRALLGKVYADSDFVNALKR